MRVDTMAAVTAVSEVTHVPVDVLLARQRGGSRDTARRVLYAVLRRVTHMSYPELGRELGVHHTTVKSGSDVAEKRNARDIEQVLALMQRSPVRRECCDAGWGLASCQGAT